MPSQSNKLSKVTSSLEHVENEIKARLSLIEALIELRYNDERRTPPTGTELANMAASWAIHFDRAEIPTDELVSLYYDSVSEWDGRGFFTPSVLVNYWNKKRDTKNLEYPEMSCGICKGTKRVLIFDWVSEENVEKDCGCAGAGDKK